MMDRQRFQRIELLFHEALLLDGPSREKLLAGAATDDPDIARQVERLIAASEVERRSGLLERLFSEDAEAIERRPDPTPGHWVGPYQLIRELGRGSSGVVYEAQQFSPRRRVALKLLHAMRPAEATWAEELIREAEILARLSHPTIATVFAAGFAEDGRPYYAMELVEGQRLDRFARRRPRGQRLELFLRICEGIDYAHRNGVIHRDLKPSNVLVHEPERSATRPADELGPAVLKIVDFGLAKLMDGDQTVSLFMGAAHGWGTPPYMSPEQRRGGKVDLRSDVYALGVILFKLMTDELPHVLDGLSLPEALYYLEHHPPRKPSQLDPALRGDLETIILNALAEEPGHRYQSAAELGDDVRRYLSDQRPARQPPSTFREIRRFARRNRGLVAAVSGVFIGLAAVLVGIGVGYMRAGDIIRQAQVVTDKRRDILAFITAEVNEIRDRKGKPRALAADWKPGLDAVRKAAQFLRLGSSPERAEPALADLVGTARASLPPGHWYTGALQGELGECLMQLGMYAQAERPLLESYESMQKSVGANHRHTKEALRRLVSLYEALGQPEKAAFRQALSDGLVDPNELTPVEPANEPEAPPGDESAPSSEP